MAKGIYQETAICNHAEHLAIYSYIILVFAAAVNIVSSFSISTV